MDDSSWAALVVEGARLGQADPLDRWAIGDLAVEAVPAGHTYAARAAAQRELERFAQDTGLKLGLVKDCYRTSLAWPVGRRFLDISHAKHSKVAAKPNRVALLLGDEVSDGLPARVRQAAEKVEELLSDATVRQAVIERSRQRRRRIGTAARTLEEEEAHSARVQARVIEEQARAELAAMLIIPGMAERAIRANVIISKMVADLLDIRTVVDQFPTNYQDRTVHILEQVINAAQRNLDVLRPTTRSPQLHDTVIVEMDGHPEAEHR